MYTFKLFFRPIEQLPTPLIIIMQPILSYYYYPIIAITAKEPSYLGGVRQLRLGLEI